MRSNLKKSSLLDRILSPSFWEGLSSSKDKAKGAYLKRDFWDLVAEDYDALEETSFYRSMQEDILQEMKKRGALRRDFTFFDVCCGTGSYALKVAPEVFRIYALDISSSMLAIFSKKIQEKGLQNIEIIEADWRTYEPPQKYNTVFVSMTPVLRDLKEVRRLINAAKDFFIAVQWAGLRKNPLAEEIEKLFFKDRKREENLGAFLIFNYLYTLGMPADIKFYQGFFERKSPLEKFWKRLKFRLEAKGYKVNPKKEKEIMKFLEKRTKDGFIETKTKVRIGALFLRKEEGTNGDNGDHC
ncbi:MAG: methyltransferase domain-containing protein [Caldimicrobium sp.]|nr:methyltransferase domain-containing protein [Caldimicrobium sp.]